MSLVTWAKKNSRALSKVGLYGIGGVLIGYPVIDFASRLWKGQGVEEAAGHAVWIGTGYSVADGSISTGLTRNAVIRTGVGALAIYAARKI